MATYIVSVREVHVQKVRITDANSPAEAKLQVMDGSGEYLDNELEYSHCLDPDSWTVEEE